jgi:K+/H+ antiporter YhaU regulatory subunit KhtT
MAKSKAKKRIATQYIRCMEELSSDFSSFKVLRDLILGAGAFTHRLEAHDFYIMSALIARAGEILEANREVFRRKDSLLEKHCNGIEEFSKIKRELDNPDAIGRDHLVKEMNRVLDSMVLIVSDLERVDEEIEGIIRTEFLIEGIILGERRKVYY